MRRPGNILLLAIVIGALTSAWVYRYLRSQQEAIEAARTTSTAATVDVVVANAQLPIGARIDANQLKIVRWPAGAEPEGTFQAIDKVAGNIARTTIEKNQPLIESQLVNQQAGLLPLLISDGMRGMSVRVDSVTGVSGFITPSSRVDVLVSGTPESGAGAEQMSKVVLQNIRVLATGTSIEHLDNKPVEVPTVTLLVSPQDAEKLTIATRQEPVRLVLRNYHDEESVPTTGVTVRALFGQERHAAPPPPPVAAPVAVRRREPVSHPSVEVILGEKVTRQEF